ncbi:MAG TPA: endonuclease/exonuclease/phosphatase family protein [Vicinamibacterales bacterium]
MLRTAALAAALVILQACAPHPRLVQAGPAGQASPAGPACRAVDGSAHSAAVQWWTPLADEDRREQLAWCRTVGPAVVRTGEVHTSPIVDRLVVVSWNVHVGGGDLHALVRDLRAGRLTEGRPVTHFVLLLQEAFRDGPALPPDVDGPFAGAIRPGTDGRLRQDIETDAERLGLYLFYVPSMRNGSPEDGMEDRGNALLSTVPLQELRAIELPFERQRRVAAAARVELRTADGGTVPLHVVSVHLDNQPGLRRLFLLAPPARTRQMRGLLDALPREGAAVLGGDLNTWFGTAEGAWVLARRAFPDTPDGDGATAGPFRLDHLFFRLPEGWTADWHVVESAYGSDHRPVVGEIRGPEAQPRPALTNARAKAGRT